MHDFDSAHGTPLPAHMFEEPWTLNLDLLQDIDDLDIDLEGIDKSDQSEQ